MKVCGRVNRYTGAFCGKTMNRSRSIRWVESTRIKNNKNKKIPE